MKLGGMCKMEYVTKMLFFLGIAIGGCIVNFIYLIYFLFFIRCPNCKCDNYVGVHFCKSCDLQFINTL